MLSLVLLGLPCWVQAEPLTGLFEATIPVMTQDVTERKTAIQMGLIDVLIKNTGILQIATRPNISSLLANSESLVARYVYRTVSGDAAAMTPLHLNMVFDQQALRARLHELDLPYWPEVRTPVVVWLVIDQPTGRRLVGRNDPQTLQWRELMIRHASRRGVSLVFPLLDKTDWETVQISDVWGGFLGPIKAASRRYETNHILSGVVNLRPEVAPSQRLNRWNLRTDFDPQAWSDSHDEARLSMEAAIDRVMASMGGYYAIRPGAHNQNQMTLLFSGIRLPVHYAQLHTFLSAQPTVTQLALLAQDGDRSVFEVTLAGQAEVFLSALRNATFLHELSGSKADAADINVLPKLVSERGDLKRYRYEEGR